MKDNIHFPSRMMALSGGLMTVSGILMALSGRLSIGGTFWASASCMFIASYYFRISENKKNKEDSNHEQETL